LGRDVDEFAKELAEMIAKRYPPALEKSPERRVSPNRITKVLEDALDKAGEFASTQRLGMFKKAKLANSFRWELKERGYSDKFIEIATEGVIVYVTRRSKAGTTTQD
jgi:ATP-dependent protease HslVU (ClpYQ) ATPase subunit